MKEIIAKVVKGDNLTKEEAVLAMNQIMEGRATDAQIGAFLTALRIKKETVEELTGFAYVMRERSVRIKVDGETDVIDTCGTGGDVKGTFNISTAAAFVVAGTGIKVAKHGNVAVSSNCGSADVLRLLRVNIEASIPTVERCIRDAGIGFLFAPMLHESMKYASKPRREIGIRTVFNILGPLTNPARAACQVIGVYDESLTTTLAEVLRNLGSKHAFVVHGMDGLDEITTTDRTFVSELVNGSVKNYYVSPEDFGIERACLEDFTVKNPEESALIIKEILDGICGPKRDIVLVNAVAAIIASGVAKDFKSATKLAAQSIDSRQAKRALERLIEISWT
ncbi:MAG TPA: anthranilate phosphoribosyltransferase [Candidatus Brocadiia bacterium]|nr:anthranilate phosphoribosyltransferase [Planctomycetota bacterium]MDO8093594.1 anthranilate phosphoribosyltransferase [Candidatus Brocadiales bacterium]